MKKSELPADLLEKGDDGSRQKSLFIKLLSRMGEGDLKKSGLSDVLKTIVLTQQKNNQDLKRLVEKAKQEQKWRGILTRKLNAILRSVALDEIENVPYPQALLLRRFQLRSQNEEDGILLAILKETGVVHRTFMDIGCGSNGGNSGILAGELGWSGVMVDVSSQAIEKIKRTFSGNSSVKSFSDFVTPANIDIMLTENNMTGEIDFFSLDIDSYDYWVFKAMTACRPRVVALEYNATFGSELSVTVPFNGIPENAIKGYHGASLAALTKLAKEKGYRLVACEPMGSNAFYIREDLAKKIPEVSVAKAFAPPMDRKVETDNDVRESYGPDTVVALFEKEGLKLETV